MGWKIPFLTRGSHLAATAQRLKTCSSQPANKIRGCDSQGCGRDSWKKHRGADVVCEDGSVVYAPFMEKIDRHSRPYRNGNAIDNRVRLSGPGFCIKMYDIKFIKCNDSIRKGEKIGVLLPMQRVYQRITSHVHIQNRDSTDPTPNL
ncbi:PREDICTED: leukocyte cell-derived chemotaxin-2-like, partial [Mesitornis unicolor]|uniref:leukocyte cell-derived chemotaxin-2-like n=1 Tax=Mesitornis unicolor TaxID=54374 RepID=UPI0005295228